MFKKPVSCHLFFRRLALPLWVLTIVLFFILLKYGAYFLMLTGGVMVIANILWATIRNVNELVIPFSAEHKLEFHFGPSFYLNLITGYTYFRVYLYPFFVGGGRGAASLFIHTCTTIVEHFNAIHVL